MMTFDRKEQRNLKKEGKKGCNDCNKVKTLDEFGFKSIKQGTHRTKCKDCRSIFERENRDDKKENKRGRDYYEKNKEQLLQRKKEYYKRTGYSRKYYLKNKQEILSKNAIYVKERYKSDDEFRFTKLLMSHLRGVKNRKEFKNLWDDIREVYDMYGVTYHIDHLIPREWFKMDTDRELVNHLDNLQVIDETYNVTKKNRWSDKVTDDYYQLIKGQIKNEYKDKLKQTQL